MTKYSNQQKSKSKNIKKIFIVKIKINEWIKINE
jgi:hypothetical protein